MNFPQRINTEHFPARFLVNVGKWGVCWEWDGGLKASGYGQFCFAGKKYAAHRFSYSLFRGGIPAGMEVCHSCDNRSCVNPDHLWLGTHTDNMRDMAAKGRCGVARGEKSRFAVLTSEQVSAILESDEVGTELARRYGVTKGAIYNIRNGRSWKEIAR